MNIIWVSHSAGLAGAERVLLEGATVLKKNGCHVNVILPNYGPIQNHLEKAGVTVSIIPLYWWSHTKSPNKIRRWRNVFSHLKSALLIKEMIKKISADLVITNTSVIPSGAIAAKLARVPHIWYIHEFGKEDHKLLFDYGDRLTRLVINTLSHKIIVNSQAVWNKYINWFPQKKMKILYYGVEIPPYITAKQTSCCLENPLKVILVGSYLPTKGQEDAIHALKILVSRGYDINLELLGYETKVYTPFLKQLSKDLGLLDRITFLPFSEDPLPIMLSNHVVLMCSSDEAFGRVTIEAFKLGLPVIGSDSGGTRELIKEGVTGLLYKPKSPQDLADKIEIFYKNRSHISEFGNNGKIWAEENFSMTKFASNLSNLIIDTCNSHR